MSSTPLLGEMPHYIPETSVFFEIYHIPSIYGIFTYSWLILYGKLLGGGNSHIFYFHPDPWGK